MRMEKKLTKSSGQGIRTLETLDLDPDIGEGNGRGASPESRPRHRQERGIATPAATTMEINEGMQGSEILL